MSILFGGWFREEQEEFEKSGCKSWAEFQEMKKANLVKLPPKQMKCVTVSGEKVCEGFVLVYEDKQYYVESIGENSEILVRRVTCNADHFYRGVYPHPTFSVLKLNRDTKI